MNSCSLIEDLNYFVNVLYKDDEDSLFFELRKLIKNQNLEFKQKQLILNNLSFLLLEDEYTYKVASVFSNYINDLLARLSENDCDKCQLFYIISNLIDLYPCVSEFVYKNFVQDFNPFKLLEKEKKNFKKFKPNNNEDINLHKILVSCLNFLYFNPEWFSSSWNWYQLLMYSEEYSQSNNNVYLILHCIRVICNVPDEIFYEKLSNSFSQTDITKLRVKYFDLFKNKFIDFSIKKNISNNKIFSKNDFNQNLVSVYGILLNKFNDFVDNNIQQEKILKEYVFYNSFEENIKKLAFAVSLNQPVIVEGTVGSGKTALIECLSTIVGRTNAPNLLKLQMGDQLDRKILIGSYHCTEIFGQFVWRPGLFTKALLNGYWLVLEDIDLAPNELISDILTILKSQSLDSLSGFSLVDAKINSSFRIFFTRRVDEGYKESNRLSNVDAVVKLCDKILMVAPNQNELESIINTKWSSLTSFSKKLIEIYDYVQSLDEFNKLNRKITLRDLFKLCNRISPIFNNKNNDASFLFLDTCDCLINHNRGFKNKLEIIKKLGIFFNFTNEQSVSIYSKRKPNIQINDNRIEIGRVSLPIKKNSDFRESKTIFAYTLQSLVLLEQLATSIVNSESCLLVGETGNGKTSTIQFLASKLQKKIIVINLNQQSESTDIIGGYKPITFELIAKKLKIEFEELFGMTFSVDENIKFLNSFNSLYDLKRWNKFLNLLNYIANKALNKDNLNKKQNLLWSQFKKKIENLIGREFEKFLAFQFIEGNLINAIKNGDWVLLDEINLAETETLQFLSYILDEKNQSFFLFDKNDDTFIEKHKDFRLFACMNPSTDVGKKELPTGIRNLFTEIFIEELEQELDLQILTETYIGNLVNPTLIARIVKLYLCLKKESHKTLNSYNSGPYYSLRTFCRALKVSSTNLCKNIKKTLYESFCLSFLTQLDQNSHFIVEKIIYNYLFGNENINISKILIPKPNEDCLEIENFKGYWLPKGSKKLFYDYKYILTESVKRNLLNLIRIISIGKNFPVLLQGETSVGKTSMIEWLAQATGNVCFRINNHEHIDLQEYIGNYTVDKFGKLVFKEGLLVEAMKNGYWIILDELNLASTEVLEALNRVLDDNREIFIPEIQETVKAHSKFILFATQNPPESYGGRKILSRAFRNRFIELRFDEIPGNELEIILGKRCSLPSSYCKKMVDVFRELRKRRKESGIFAGKLGFVTLRDLFRWGERYLEFSKTITDTFYNWENYLAIEGFMLIGGRVRKNDELIVVKEILETKFKTKIDETVLYDNLLKEIISCENFPDKFKHIVWTKNSIKLCCLLFTALKYKEPVLLVGETGCGKTTFCQVYAELIKKKIYTINCHMNTESADFIGSLRPVRNRSDQENNENKLFEWVDGPLINAMNEGSVFLVDEISLADDSVLERFNSLLEPKRTLFLAEKISTDQNDKLNNDNDDIKIISKDDFRFIATMNPGGDYAKKELSLALRNRFTEIWCNSDFDKEDINKIIIHNLSNELFEYHQNISNLILDFLIWFNTKILVKTSYSIRDILTLVEFINSTTSLERQISLSVEQAVYHSIILMYIDSIGSSAITSFIEPSLLKNEAINYLENLIKNYFNNSISLQLVQKTSINNDKYFSLDNFYIERGKMNFENRSNYVINSPSVNLNCVKILRAMQHSKSILLEGVPGVGKTSLIQVLAKITGHDLIRINLSEQTDINDLFGSDLPVEGEEAKFKWRDGPLLNALKDENCWILLDELNLASQSVLEGLNACLDHRGEIFIPELNKTFILNKNKTRIFASQNPYVQGGGRKGLPKSFLNRFLTIFIESFSQEDMIFILSNIFPEIPKTVLQNMVSFNEDLLLETIKKKRFTTFGYPWEFNLRDLTRWCELIVREKIVNCDNNYEYDAKEYVNLIYFERFRTIEDKKLAIELFEKKFNLTYTNIQKEFLITKNYLQIGNSVLKKNVFLLTYSNFYLFPQQFSTLNSIMKCIEMNWMTILVGDTNVGKSSLVNLISHLTGNELKLLSVNTEMDSTELLGSFEQKDFIRQYKLLEKKFWISLKKIIQNVVFINKKEQYPFFEKILFNWFTKNSLFVNENNELNLFLKKLSFLKNLVCQMNNLSLEKEINDLEIILKNTSSLNGNGTFEWIDSIFIEAIRNGNWLLIDNANLCSASVLDRINSLLEPNGFLLINERGSINNKIPLIKPHPNFRLFITMNPKNGELSRAMRNRGIEIFVEKQDLNYMDSVLQNFKFNNLIEKELAIKKLFRFNLKENLNNLVCFKYFVYYVFNLMKSNKNTNLLELNENDNQLVQKLVQNDVLILNSKKIFFDVNLFNVNIVFDIYQNLKNNQNKFLSKNYLENEQTENLFLATIFKIIFENISFNNYKFLLNYINTNETNYFLDDNLINFIYNTFSNIIKTKNHHLEVEEIQLDYRFNKKLINYFIKDKSINLKLEKISNIWSLNLFLNQLNLIQNKNLVNFNQNTLFGIGRNSIDNSIEEYAFSKKLLKELFELINKFIIFNSNLKEISNEVYYEIKSCCFWIHHLVQFCFQFINRKNSYEKLDNFICIWILILQKNVFNLIEKYFELDLASSIKKINQLLNIDYFINIKDYSDLLKQFYYENLPVNLLQSEIYCLIWKQSSNLLNKDYSFIFCHKSHLNNLCEIYENLQLNSTNRDELFLKLTDFESKLNETPKFDSIEEERKNDFELISKFENAKISYESNLYLIHQLLFFILETDYLNSNKKIETKITSLNKLKFDQAILNPFHKILFKKQHINKFELILHHYLDCFKIIKNDLIFNIINFQEISILKLNDQKLNEYKFKIKGFLQESYWYKDEFHFETSPIFTLLLSKNLKENLNLGYVEYQESQILEIITVIQENYFKFFDTFLNSKKFYQNLLCNWIENLNSKILKLFNYNEIRVQLLNLVKKLEHCVDLGESNYLQSMIGILTCKLFSPITIIDPIERNNCKLENYELELDYSKVELQMRKFIDIYKNGTNITEFVSDHPHVQQLIKRINVLEKKKSKLCLNKNIRPKPSLYFQMKKEIDYFVENILYNNDKFTYSFINLKNFIDKNQIVNDTILESISNSLNFKKQIYFFMNDLLAKYCQYYDLISNFLLGICFIYQSLSSIISNANKKIALNRLNLKENCLDNINYLLNYSNSDYNSIINRLLNLLNTSEFLNLFNRTRNGSQHCLTIFYKSTLMEISNSFAFETDDSKSLILMDVLIKKFLNTWKQEQEAKRLKKEQEEALYVYKFRNSEETVNDEELLKKNIDLTFPTFEDFYSDLLNNENENKEYENENNFNLTFQNENVDLNPDLLLDIIELHKKILLSINFKNNLNYDFKNSFKMRYTILTDLVEIFGPILDKKLDEITIDGHLIVYQNLNEILFSKKEFSNDFNIYTDNNFNEIQKCYSILESFRKKIIENLSNQLFYGHFTLKQLLKLILRIYSIQTTQPLIKFLTGLEILLQVAQDWEEVASHEFKLIYQLDEIKNLILHWRKLELDNYINCLNNVRKKIRKNDFLKWWFHFYATINDLLTKDLIQQDIDEFFDLIKQFIEDATIGEFEFRLELLENFIMHLNCIKQNHQLLNMMINLLNYYKQFESVINKTINELQQEYDKQIQEKIKVIRWKKVNYIGLKNLIKKSHKTVMRNINKFERSLSKKANYYFYNTNITWQNVKKPRWKFEIQNFNENLIKKFDVPLKLNSGQDYFSKFEHLNQNCILYISNCFESTNTYKNRIIDFNLKINSIVENINELKKIKIDCEDLEKRKKLIKSLYNQKDFNFSELLKFLKKIGLSYQKGLNNEEKLNNNLIKCCTFLKENQYLNENLKQDLSSIQKYFYESYLRFICFIDLSKIPSQNINQQKLIKLKGFILNLMMIVKENRTNLSDELYNFEILNNKLFEFGKSDEDSILTKKLINKLNFIKEKCKTLKILLLKSQDVANVLIKSNCQNNEWVKFLEKFNLEIPILLNSMQEIKINQNFIFYYSNQDLIKINDILVNVCIRIVDCLHNLNIDKLSQNCIFVSILEFSRNLIQSLSKQKQEEHESGKNELLDNNKIDLLNSETKLFINKILFRIQEVYKYFQQNDNNILDEVDEKDLLSQLCKINDLWKILDIKSIKNSLINYLDLCQSICINSFHQDCNLVKTFFKYAYVFTKNFLTLAEYSINIYICKQRCTNKFLFILLGLFNELSKNGFCLPSDLQEDEKNEIKNDGKFKEIEGTGIGDGVGEKDVSDQIDNLNQIEGLEKDEKTTDEEKNADIKEEDGIKMDEDFEGENFDKTENENDDNNENTDEDEENEMGEVKDNNEVLDEELWGKDNDLNDTLDDLDKSDKKGKDQKDNQLVANEDLEKFEKDSKNENKDEDINKDENENEDEDEDDSDLNKEDIYKNRIEIENNGENKSNELDIPDDLKLDENEKNQSSEGSDLEDEYNESNENDVNNDDNDLEDEKIDEIENNDFDKNKIDSELESDPENEKQNQDSLDENMKIYEDIEEEESENNKNSIDSFNEINNKTDFNEDFGQRNQFENEQNNKETFEKDGYSNNDKFKSLNENYNYLSNETKIEKDLDFNFERPIDQDQMKKNKCLSDEFVKAKKRKQILNEKDDSFDGNKKLKENQNLESNLFKHIDESESGDDDIIDKADEIDISNKIDLDLDEKEDEKVEQNVKLNKEDDLDENLEKANIKKNLNSSNRNSNMNEIKKDGKTNQKLNDKSYIKTTFIERPSESYFNTDLSTLNCDSNLTHLNNLLDKISSCEANSEELNKEACLAWRECENIVSPLISQLVQQLQLILEPTKSSKFKGDFKTGKRLNMRKIIPYIASQYRKDKIWLRRNKPSKREYQIVLALDDSGSMIDNESKALAFESLILLGKSLNLLEVGEIGIMSFGEEAKILKFFEQPFNDNFGVDLLSKFTFNQTKTRLNDLLRKVQNLMEKSKFNKKLREVSQLLVIISDGRGLFSEGEKELKAQIKQIYDKGIFVVFLILDNPKNKNSILDVIVPEFSDSGDVKLTPYMDKFPFPFYIILRSVNKLPNVLGQALRQWFELVTINDK